ncbi:hypothetical protein, partial [Cronobacter sakazakii]|uniref:hypothetical protein n=8 Tax=Cronobacter sakazakii TaxID=28141 RepID=UPI00358E651A
PRENSPGRWINHREEKTRMNTQNVNTAAQESSRKMAGKPLSLDQITDLFCYVMDCSQSQKQPGCFIPPPNGDLILAQSEDGSKTAIIWTQNGWPLCASVPEDYYLAVLSGIPL